MKEELGEKRGACALNYNLSINAWEFNIKKKLITYFSCTFPNAFNFDSYVEYYHCFA